jgi:CO/xanthine dehydrogenase Mo-binding subunit
VIHDVEVAATEEGKLLGFRVKELCDMGAYFQLLTPGIPELGGWVYMGPYDTQGYWYEFTGVMTNMAPTDASAGPDGPRRPTSSNARSTPSRGTSARTRPRSGGSASRRATRRRSRR